MSICYKGDKMSMLKRMIILVLLTSLLSVTVMAQGDGMKRVPDDQEAQDKRTKLATESETIALQDIFEAAEILCVLKNAAEKREERDEEQDLSEKVKLYQQQVTDTGDARAMNALGVCLSKGHGVEMNKERAVLYFQ